MSRSERGRPRTVRTKLRRAVVMAIAALPVIALVAFVGTTSLVATSQTAEAAACVTTIKHWGKYAPYRWLAKRKARRGIRWKRRYLGYRAYGPIRIIKCKKRRYRAWQCRARQNVNVC